MFNQCKHISLIIITIIAYETRSESVTLILISYNNFWLTTFFTLKWYMYVRDPEKVPKLQPYSKLLNKVNCICNPITFTVTTLT